MLQRLARLCYRRRRYVLVAWLLALVLVSVLSKVAGGKDATNFSLPGTESQQAIDLLKAKFPARSGDTADIVFAAPGPGGVDRFKPQIEAAVAAAARANPHISAVISPFDVLGARQVSADRHVAFAEIQLDVISNDLPKTAGPAIEAAVRSAAPPGAGLQEAFGGFLFTSRTPPGGTEAVGLLAGIIILVIAFGSLLAMVMPMFIAIFSIVIGLGLIALLANVMEIASFTSLITAMIGIGVGIDYALFIVTRYRQGLHDGLPPDDAIATALATSGRAVLFAGCTVVIALMGMFLMELSFVNGLAVGAAFAVLITMVASVTLLPAMLGFAGPNIDKLHVPWFHSSVASTEVRRGFWFGWSRRIQRRPWPFAVAALGAAPRARLPGHPTEARLPRCRQRSEGHDHPHRVRPARDRLRSGLQRSADRGRQPAAPIGHGGGAAAGRRPPRRSRQRGRRRRCSPTPAPTRPPP